MQPGDKLRRDAGEMRQHVKNVLDADQSEWASVRQQIGAIVQAQSLAEAHRLAESLLATLPSPGSLTKQTTAITGAVTANVYDALADHVDFLLSHDAATERNERTKQVLDRNHAIRTAAAKGDWDAVFAIAEGAAAKGAADEGGDQATDGDGHR